jgi:hypothetical protein
MTFVFDVVRSLPYQRIAARPHRPGVPALSQATGTHHYGNKVAARTTTFRFEGKVRLLTVFV